MTKELFLSELKKELHDASASKIEICVDDYSKRIDAMMEAGLSEEEAVAKQGRPCDIAFVCLVFSIVMLIETFLPLKALDKPQNIQISLIITFGIFAVLRTNQLTSDFSFSLVVLYSFLAVAILSIAGLIAHAIINRKHSVQK